MIVKKNRVINIPTFNCDDRKKFSAFVALLVQIDKCINADTHAETSKTRTKKAKKARKPCGPLRLSSGQAFLLPITALSLWELFKICSIGKAYDRYSSIITSPGFIPNY